MQSCLCAPAVLARMLDMVTTRAQGRVHVQALCVVVVLCCVMLLLGEKFGKKKNFITVRFVI